METAMTFENLTGRVQDAINKSGIREGLVLVETMHAALRAR
jgi:thiamine phosphate synthase YjbQ (UPF0047 family)